MYAIRAFSSSVSNAKYLAFDTPNSKKPPSSSVLNAIIFGIDEQCNLIFETALYTNCKTYIIFYSGGVHFLFFLLFLSHFHFFHLSFLLWDNHFSALSLPLLNVSASLSNETQAGASNQADLYRNGFFFLFLFLRLWFDGRFSSGCVGYGFGVLGRGLMCSSDFMGLGLWVWVHRSRFVGLRSWIIDMTNTDRRVNWRGSSTWLVSSAWVIDLIGMGLWSLWWSLEL